MNIRAGAITLAGLLPASRIKNFLLRRCGWKIDLGVVVHPSIFIRIQNVQLLEGSSTGLFNVFRHLRRLSLGVGATVGQFNWVTGGAPGLPNDDSFLELGEQSAITSRHYLDASGGITIGKFATLAGERSVLLTHQIDYRESKQSIGAVTIGEYSLVSSSVKVVPGAVVPSFSVVAMGSVITPGLVQENALYAGVPAVLKRRDLDGKYFHRSHGPVEPRLGK